MDGNGGGVVKLLIKPKRRLRDVTARKNKRISQLVQERKYLRKIVQEQRTTIRILQSL